MLYSKSALGLYECSEEFLKDATRILREDKNAAMRLRLTAQLSADDADTYLTQESASFLTGTDEAANNWVSVIGAKSLSSRDVSSYAEAARNENAPISPPMAMIVIQTGISYLNLLNTMNSGSNIYNMTVSRVHHGGAGGVITPTESHSYSNCQILLINKQDIGNVSLACLIIQSTGLTLTYAPVAVGGGAPSGSYQASLTSSASSTSGSTAASA